MVPADKWSIGRHNEQNDEAVSAGRKTEEKKEKKPVIAEATDETD